MSEFTPPSVEQGMEFFERAITPLMTELDAQGQLNPAMGMMYAYGVLLTIAVGVGKRTGIDPIQLLENTRRLLEQHGEALDAAYEEGKE